MELLQYTGSLQFDADHVISFSPAASLEIGDDIPGIFVLDQRMILPTAAIIRLVQ